MLGFLSRLLAPIKAYLVGAGVALAVLTAAFTKGWLKGRQSITDKIEKETTDAVRKANDARARARAQFASGRLRDEWTRD